jgi:hypothetical protein
VVSSTSARRVEVEVRHRLLEHERIQGRVGDREAPAGQRQVEDVADGVLVGGTAPSASRSSSKPRR